AEQRRNKIGLGREIAVDRPGRDAGAAGDCRDLHRRHAAFARRLPRRGNDGVAACRQAAGNVLCAAVRHGAPRKGNRACTIAKDELRFGESSLAPWRRRTITRPSPPATWRESWRVSWPA